MVLIQNSLLYVLIIFGKNGFLASQSSEEDDDLAFVQVVSRSGARSPLVVYPNDPYKDFWKKGLGQLTKYGVFQTNELGQYLRQRYIDGKPFKFLSHSYDSKEIYVRSSDRDRTIMSAVSCMNGLYPTNDSLVNMLAIRTVPQSEDKILQSVNCTLYEKVWQEVARSSEVESARLNNVDLLQGLAKYTKMEIVSFESVTSIADNLKCLVTENASLPDWSIRSKNGTKFVQFISRMADFYTSVRYDRKDEARLTSGRALLKHLVDSMSRGINGNFTAFPTKAEFYFTHENIMASLLSTMDVFNGRSPPFASSIFFELYHRENFTVDSKNFRVKTLFRNSSRDSPHVLQIPGCEEKCPFDRFIELTKHNFVSNPKEECEEPIKETKERDYLLVALGCACVLCIVIALFSLLFAFVSYRSTRVYRKYVDVPTEIE